MSLQPPHWYYKLNSSPDACLNCQNVTARSVIVCRQDEYRKYAVFNSFNEFGQYLFDHSNPRDKCYYEVIRGNMPHKMYFDIDLHLDKYPDISPPELMNTLVHAIIGHFAHVGVTRDDCIITSSSLGSKASYHLVIDNWYVYNAVQARLNFEHILARMPSRFHPALDAGMYKSLQQFRLLGCCKYQPDPNQPIRTKVLDPMSTWRMKEKIPSKCNPEFFIHTTVLRHTMVSRVNGCHCLPIIEVPERPHTEIVSIGPEAVAQIQTAIVNFHDGEETFKFKKFKDGYVIFERTRPAYCPTCQRHHQHENAFAFVNQEMEIIFGCRRGACRSIGSLGDTSSQTGVTDTESFYSLKDFNPGVQFNTGQGLVEGNVFIFFEKALETESVIALSPCRVSPLTSQSSGSRTKKSNHSW